MHIFTTAHDPWLLEGLRQALHENCAQTTIRVSSIISAGHLLTITGNRLPHDMVLLPSFPDNNPIICLHSLAFLSEWKSLQAGLLRYRAPCILWGKSPVIRIDGHLPVIPWRTPPRHLGLLINNNVQAWSRHAGRQSTVIFQPNMRLTPREIAVLRFTLEGQSLSWIAEELGISDRTVWTHRRRAMDELGIRRLHDLMQVSSDVLCRVVPVLQGEECVT